MSISRSLQYSKMPSRSGGNSLVHGSGTMAAPEGLGGGRSSEDLQGSGYIFLRRHHVGGHSWADSMGSVPERVRAAPKGTGYWLQCHDGLPTQVLWYDIGGGGRSSRRNHAISSSSGAQRWFQHCPRHPVPAVSGGAPPEAPKLCSDPRVTRGNYAGLEISWGRSRCRWHPRWNSLISEALNLIISKHLQQLVAHTFELEMNYCTHHAACTPCAMCVVYYYGMKTWTIFCH